MIRRTLMDVTTLDEWLLSSHIRCVYMHVAEAEDQWTSGPHSHEYNEICYVSSGSGKYVIDDTEYSMSGDNVFLLPKGCMHMERQETWESYNLCFLMIDITGPHASEIEQFFFGAPKRVQPDQPYDVKRIFDRVIDEIIKHGEGYLSIVEAEMKNLFVLIWRRLSGQEIDVMTNNRSNLLHRREYLSERMRIWVLDNLEHTFTIHDVAGVFHYHPKYLTTLIRSETGKTLTEYILSIRLDRACELLAHSQYAVQSIISMCGFGNNAYFYRVFKEYTGMTPSQYRISRINAPRDQLIKL